MKISILVISLFISSFVFSQRDTAYLHNGKIIVGNIVRIAEQTVIYKNVNEDVEQTIGKYAVSTIVYGKSGRMKTITSKVEINSKSDWKNVVVLENSTAAIGLTKIADIKSQPPVVGYENAGGNVGKYTEKLQKEAVDKGGQFIVIIPI